MSLSTCQCVKTQVGSVSPFWILNKYLKLRQWNDAPVAVCFFEETGGKFLAWLRVGGGVEGWRGALLTQLPPKERGQGEIWCLRVRGLRMRESGPAGSHWFLRAAVRVPQPWCLRRAERGLRLSRHHEQHSNYPDQEADEQPAASGERHGHRRASP